jgi:undecaprenyl-diphosphatase
MGRDKRRKRGILFLQVVFFVMVYAAIFLFLRSQLGDVGRIVNVAEEVYGAYGYYLIFLGAMVEGTFVLGFYIPGSLIVLLGVSLARLGITSFPLVIFFGALGFCLGYCINYCLGRYGWYKVIEGIGFEKQLIETEKKLRKHYTAALFWGYIMPSTGALLSTASGILRIPFREFLFKTVLIQFLWSLVIGGLAYMFGNTFIHVFLIYFGTIAFLSFVMYLGHRFLKRKRSRD